MVFYYELYIYHLRLSAGGREFNSSGPKDKSEVGEIVEVQSLSPADGESDGVFL